MGGSSLTCRIKCSALIGASLLWVNSCLAAPPADFSNGVRETQLFLYLSKPFASSTARTWGLRIDQASAPAIVPSSIVLGPLHRRELVNLMFTRHVQPRIQFGGRLTWDLRANQLSLQHR